jgi:hypothetical protein
MAKDLVVRPRGAPAWSRSRCARNSVRWDALGFEICDRRAAALARDQQLSPMAAPVIDDVCGEEGGFP